MASSPWQAEEMEPIRLTFSLTRKDLLAALRLMFRPLRLGLITGGLLAAYVAVSFPLAGYDFRSTLMAVLATLLGFGLLMVLVLWFISLPLSAWRQSRNNRAFHQDLEFTADEAGLRVRNGRGEVISRWDDLRGYREDNRVLAIVLTKSLVQPIPCAALSPAQRDALKARMRRLGRWGL